MWEEQLKQYDTIVDQCPRFDRKGKSMIYTSANGYMFTLLNKAGEIGVRFSKDEQEKYIKEFNSSLYKSYGAVMKGYVLIPDTIVADTKKMITLFNESYDYVMTLEPK